MALARSMISDSRSRIRVRAACGSAMLISWIWACMRGRVELVEKPPCGRAIRAALLAAAMTAASSVAMGTSTSVPLIVQFVAAPSGREDTPKTFSLRSAAASASKAEASTWANSSAPQPVASVRAALRSVTDMFRKPVIRLFSAIVCLQSGRLRPTNAVGLGSFAETTQSSRPGCHHVRCGPDHPLSMAASAVECRWRIAAGRDAVRPQCGRAARAPSRRSPGGVPGARVGRAALRACGAQPGETPGDRMPLGARGGSPSVTEQAVDSLQTLFDGVDVHRHPGRRAPDAGAGVEVLPHGGKQVGGVQSVPLTEVGEHAVHESGHLVRCGAEHRGIGGEVLDRVDSL